MPIIVPMLCNVIQLTQWGCVTLEKIGEHWTKIGVKGTNVRHSRLELTRSDRRDAFGEDDAQNPGTKAVYHLTFRGPCSRHSRQSKSRAASRVTRGGSRHWLGVTSGKLSSPSPQVRLAPAIPMLYAWARKV